jgi:hypothetical protein
MITRATYTQKTNARYAYIAPFYRQAKDVAWVYLKDYAAPFITKIRESELRVELFNGAWITLYGADNPDALRGLYLDGVIMDEYGDSRPSLWEEVVLPTLADRKGWAIFIGTPKGKNHFYKVYQRSKIEQGWFHMTLKASESGLLDDEELGEMKRLMDPDKYQQEMECDFLAAVKGTYYSDKIQKLEAEGFIGEQAPQYDPSKPVFMSTDLGRSDSTAMWFWQRSDNPAKPVSIIDYYENDGQDLEHYFDFLEGRSYKLAEIWLPHDAKAKTLATKRSTIEQFMDWRDLYDVDIDVQLIPKLGVQHGIDAARKILGLCTINTTTCYNGVEALRAYQRKYHEINQSFGEAPLHNWASNGADGFRYLSLVALQTSKQKETSAGGVSLPPRALNLDNLFKDSEVSQTSFQKLRM